MHAGADEVNPNTLLPTDNGIDWSTRGATGAVLPLELGYATTFANDALPRDYGIGAIIDRSDYPDPVLDTRGGAALFSGLTPRTRFGRSLVYARFDQMIRYQQVSLELNDGIQRTPAARLTPNIQDIVNPDTTRFPFRPRPTPDAFVVGAKFSLDLFTLADLSKGRDARDSPSAQYLHWIRAKTESTPSSGPILDT